jgi:hypothetical protein
MKLLPFALLCFLPVACGGSIAATVDSGAPKPTSDSSVTADAHAVPDGSSHADVTGAHDAGVDCGQPPSPMYGCAAGDGAEFDGGACGAYGADATAKGPAYPFGCTVTTSTCDLGFGGPLTCNCQRFPGNDAGPTWICAL